MRILVADDSPSFRSAITRMLVEAGYDVIRARDGVEALTVFYREQPDVVLLDLLMPRLTGWVVCRIIKEDPVFSRTPVLVLTGAGDAENRYWAERSGADAFLTKDEFADELLDRVQALITTRALADLAGGPAEESVGELGAVDVLARVCEMLDRKLFETTIAHDITAIATLSLDLQKALDRTLQTLHHLVDFDAAAVALIQERTLAVWTPRRLDTWMVNEFHDRVLRQLDEVAGAPVGSADFARWVSVGVDEPTGAAGWRSEYQTRLVYRGRLVGVLVLASSSAEVFDDRAHRTLRAVAPAIVTVVDSARMYHGQESHAPREIA